MNTSSASHDSNAIGILGGTFDPIHYGHINPAKEAAKALGLTQVYLLPAKISPHKNTTFATAGQRATMVQLLCQQEPLFKADLRELQRETPSYTNDTLIAIKREQPNSVIYFFIGSDSLLTLTRWHQWQNILSLCHLVVSSRPGFAIEQLSNNNSELWQYAELGDINVRPQKSAGSILLSTNTRWDISSTQIRNLIKTGRNCTQLAPKNVLDYINQQQLYR